MSNWKKIFPEQKKIIIWGGGDQCRVNMPILQDLGSEVLAIVDDTKDLIAPFKDIPLLYGFDQFIKWLSDKDPKSIGFVIAIGNPYGHIRNILHDKLCQIGLKSVSFSDLTASIRNDVKTMSGLQVMPHAIIHNNVEIHKQCIINTRALIEHDCILKQGVEIGPGAILCGRVIVNENSWIGAGSTIRPRVTIGSNVIVGAGAVVVNDIPDGVVVAGVPAKVIINKITPSHVFNNIK
jgi:sugar O-acyltransferase (sialic acid O-acetyltransferase NeuD family)